MLEAETAVAEPTPVATNTSTEPLFFTISWEPPSGSLEEGFVLVVVALRLVEATLSGNGFISVPSIFGYPLLMFLFYGEQELVFGLFWG
jgi:hypothetical protein